VSATGRLASDAIVRSTARTHVGLKRRINEDRVFDWPDGGVWAVADGMGGHRGGDLAAQSVIDSLRTLYAPDPADVMAALHRANAVIAERNNRTGEQAGTTVVALMRDGDGFQVAWAGDSRCYRVRDGRMALLTHDHSVVQELVDAGLVSAEDAHHHPHANVVTRALGVNASCVIDTRRVDARAGDHLLICSDGLSRSLVDGDIADAVTDLDLLADTLIAQALRRDGSDNISLVLIAA
jgi:serine/threonine protein phosphatase PrpC